MDDYVLHLCTRFITQLWYTQLEGFLFYTQRLFEKEQIRERYFLIFVLFSSAFIYLLPPHKQQPFCFVTPFLLISPFPPPSHTYLPPGKNTPIFHLWHPCFLPSAPTTPRSVGGTGRFIESEVISLLLLPSEAYTATHTARNNERSKVCSWLSRQWRDSDSSRDKKTIIPTHTPQSPSVSCQKNVFSCGPVGSASYDQPAVCLRSWCFLCVLWRLGCSLGIKLVS